MTNGHLASAASAWVSGKTSKTRPRSKHQTRTALALRTECTDALPLPSMTRTAATLPRTAGLMILAGWRTSAVRRSSVALMTCGAPTSSNASRQTITTPRRLPTTIQITGWARNCLPFTKHRRDHPAPCRAWCMRTSRLPRRARHLRSTLRAQVLLLRTDSAWSMLLPQRRTKACHLHHPHL